MLHSFSQDATSLFSSVNFLLLQSCLILLEPKSIFATSIHGGVAQRWRWIFFWEPGLPPESENGVAASFEAGIELVHGRGGVGSMGAQSSGGGFFRVWRAAARGGRCGEEKEKQEPDQTADKTRI